MIKEFKRWYYTWNIRELDSEISKYEELFECCLADIPSQPHYIRITRLRLEYQKKLEKL